MPQWMYSPFFAVILTVGSLLVILSLIQTDAQLQESAAIVDSFSEDIEILRTEVANTAMLAQEATSAAAQERIIRDELLMQVPGEYVVQLPNLETVEQRRNEALAAEIASKNNARTTSALDAWWQLLVD